MDFFASQDQAHRQTRRLIGLFLLAVGCIVAALNFLAGTLYVVSGHIHAASFGAALFAVPPNVYWLTTLAVLALILGGTFYRMASLSGGGAAVAEMVGAREIHLASASASEQRLIHVVEEMAIASGTRIPRVFVMDGQRGINAFAAGYSPNEAAIAVTQGALEQLDRDELQGVIAHEFSHILNGDMRLSIQLIGVVAGLVLIGDVGSFFMQFGRGDSDLDVRRRGDARLVILGLCIWLIGSVGVFFGALIKAAISRQREYLADASAVQFTRNPQGIGGALIKIGDAGSNVVHLHARELSHMYFGQVDTDFFATHPPLEDRITRILGSARAELLKRSLKNSTAVVDAQMPESPAFASVAPQGAMPASMLASVGNCSAANVQRAQQLIDTLPAEVRRAASTQAGARAVLYALLLDGDEVRQRQLSIIAAGDHPTMADATERLAELIKPLGVATRMPIFSLAMASLRDLASSQRAELLHQIEALVNADGKVSLEEFVLLSLCKSQLNASPARNKRATGTLQVSSAAASTILALLVRVAQASGDVYAKAMERLHLAPTDSDTAQLSFHAVDAALVQLNLLEPLGKRDFIDACLHVVTADNKVTVAEGELMRAICAALEVPLPVLIEEAQIG